MSTAGPQSTNYLMPRVCRPAPTNSKAGTTLTISPLHQLSAVNCDDKSAANSCDDPT